MSEIINKDVVFWLSKIAESLGYKGVKPVETNDITKLTPAQLDSLNPGDVVIKHTGNQMHTYIVSYKGKGVGEGICLSYNASGYGETVSYDFTESGWAYNSTDINTYGN